MAVMVAAGVNLSMSGSVVLADSEMGPPSEPVPRTLFGMHRHVWPKKPEPWPDIPIGTFRMWDSATGWAQINTRPGKYDWHQIDDWFHDLQDHGVVDILYTFARTPQFASSQPNADCGYGPGECAPPKDLNPDGTGANQYWKDYVTAIVTHSKNNKGIHIKYWELWNEPYLPKMWMGTLPQLVRMARDAHDIIHSIDPDAVFLTPPSGLESPRYRQFMDDFLAAGGGQYVDGISYHGYIHAPAPATDFVKYYPDFVRILKKYGQDSKLTYNTEASWANAGSADLQNDDEYQAAFITQFYLLHWSMGVRRLYWYAYNDGRFGKLYDHDSRTQNKAARAYRTLFNWMVGSTMTKGCAPDDGVWTCGFTRPDGREALVVWTEGGEKSYTPKATLKKCTDVEGHESTIAGPVKIGRVPLFLEAK